MILFISYFSPIYPPAITVKRNTSHRNSEASHSTDQRIDRPANTEKGRTIQFFPNLALKSDTRFCFLRIRMIMRDMTSQIKNSNSG
jgi:hypothetical protein